MLLQKIKKNRVKLIHVNSNQITDITDKFKYSIWFGNYVADGLAQNTIQKKDNKKLIYIFIYDNKKFRYNIVIRII